jgi:signal transduction histidine kinase
MKKRLKLLVVDDDQTVHKLIQRLLTCAGILADILDAPDAASAIAALKTQACDAVILESCLPDQMGWSLIQALRALGVRAPLIALTRQQDMQAAVKLMKAGASDCLVKSELSSQTVVNALLESIQHHQAKPSSVSAYLQSEVDCRSPANKIQPPEDRQHHAYLQGLELMEAKQLKSTFVSTLSHELRTPLNAILGFAQILLRNTHGPLSQSQFQMTERIFVNAKQMLELINDILDFSQLESGRLDVNVEPFNIESLVVQNTNELAPLATQKNLSLQVQVDLQNPQMVSAPTRVKQIVLNLLSNAIKFTECGSITVQVNEITTNRIAIAVQDTGIGIAPEQLQLIFEPFRQVNQSNTRRYTGTGLGLAITGLLVKLMQGEITVESQPGVGSRFQIELPRYLYMNVPKQSACSSKRILRSRID